MVKKKRIQRLGGQAQVSPFTWPLYPERPDFVSFGESCTLKANHFHVELRGMNFHEYDVRISPEDLPCSVNRVVMGELVKLYRHSHLGGRLPVYDGRDRLYTAGPFPFSSMTFEITLQDEEDSLDDGQAPKRHERLFKVVIEFRDSLPRWKLGWRSEHDDTLLQVLNIVLREITNARPYYPVARSFYSPYLGSCHLGEGLKIYSGFYQSIQLTQMGFSLIFDISSKAFIELLPVIDFVAQLLNRPISDGPLNDVECLKIKEALQGIKVHVTHRGNVRKKYRISDLTSEATSELFFSVDDRGTLKSVMQHFQETYGFNIEHIALPCLQVGNQQRPIYLPMEVCKIAEGQHYSKQLNAKQIAALRDVTCQHPIKHEESILQTLHENAYIMDPYAKEFGIYIDNRLTTVEGRVLPPPVLKFHDSGTEKTFLPKDGQWNMRRKRMVNGGRVHNWTCINFSLDVLDTVATTFCNELVVMCQISGMDFRAHPVLPVVTYRPEHIERALKVHHQAVMRMLGPQGRELGLLIVILPDYNGSLYGDLKRICETDIGLVSQCCLAKHVFTLNKQYLANVALKINVKVGGRNTVLLDALKGNLPRVVASQDWPEVTKYAGLVSAQTHHKEMIDDLFIEHDCESETITGGMIKEHLISFQRATGVRPQRIIFYRDGISRGQLNQVVTQELCAIKKACISLAPDYNPRVTFVVVKKRHHTRLFSDKYDVGSIVYGSGNILPGTVVDSKICHPAEFDFYLCSHAGTKGVSLPVCYHVVFDENKFTANSLQSLTNHLCYTYARCTSSVSIVPPVYYAHLLAARSRFYIGPTASDAATSRAPSSSKARGRGAAGGVTVRPLPAIKENVKRVMFFC